MNAEQLIQQYDAGAITERELVEGVWERIEVAQDCYQDWYYSVAELYDSTSHFSTEEAAWTAAAAFTCERVEEIRKDKDAIRYLELCNDHQPEIQHTLALVHAHLDTLSHGVKPEALAF